MSFGAMAVHSLAGSVLIPSDVGDVHAGQQWATQACALASVCSRGV